MRGIQQCYVEIEERDIGQEGIEPMRGASGCQQRIDEVDYFPKR